MSNKPDLYRPSPVMTRLLGSMKDGSHVGPILDRLDRNDLLMLLMEATGRVAALERRLEEKDKES